jgi:hypothetical protein
VSQRIPRRFAVRLSQPTQLKRRWSFVRTSRAQSARNRPAGALLSSPLRLLADRARHVDLEDERAICSERLPTVSDFLLQLGMSILI